MNWFFFSSRRRHTRCSRDWSSDVCSSDLEARGGGRRGDRRRSSAARRRALSADDRPDERANRSEERRVGKECRTRWAPYPLKKKKNLSDSGERRMCTDSKHVVMI